MAKFAPPTEEELDKLTPATPTKFAPPTAEQLQTLAQPEKSVSKFAPPTSQELESFGIKKPEVKEGGAFIGENIQMSELEDIASRNKVDVSLLKRLAPYYGASVEGEEGISQTIGRGVGFASEALGGIPTFVAKKISPEIGEKEERALDELNELAQKKKSYLQAGAEMASALAIPGAAAVKGGKLAATAAAGIEGAAYGLGESKKGEELESAALGAGVGVAAGPVIAGVVKGAKAAKQLYKAYRAPKKEAADIAREASKLNPAYKIEEDLTGDMVEGWKNDADNLYDELRVGPNADRAKEIAKDSKDMLGNQAKGNPVEALREKALTMNQEDFGTFYVRAKQIKAIKDAEPSRVSSTSEVSTGMSRILNIVADGSTEARDIDIRNGSSFLEAMLDFGRGANLTGYAHKAFQKKISKSNRELYSFGKAGNLRAFEALNDHSKISSLPKKEQETVNTFKDFLEEVRVYANEKGVPIAKLKGGKAGGYLPKRSVDIAEASVRVESKANEIAKLTGINPFKVTEEQWQKILTEGTKENLEFKPLQQTLLAYTGKAADSADEFSSSMNALINPSSDVFSKEIDIRALHKRMDVLPSYLVETNVVKLVNGYLADTVKYIYQKDAINKLDFEIKKLAAIKGANNPDVIQMKKRLNNVLGEVSGIPSVAKRAELTWRAATLRAASRMDEGTPGREFLESIVDAPDLVRSLRNNVYGNFLQGFPQFINNINGALSTFVPEMGNIYGVRLLPGAMMKVMANMGKRSYWNQLAKKGYLQAEPGREFVEAAKGGKPTPLVLRGLEGLSNTLSLPFSRAEYLIRAFTYEAGEMVFDQVKKGLVPGGKMPKMASRYFDTMPASFQNSIRKQMEAGNEQRARQLFDTYLADRVAFSYNKMSQSTAARNLGPSIAAFSKYPSVMVGRALEVWRENEGFKKAPAFFNYFIASYVAMSAVNALIFSNHQEIEEKIFGRQEEGLLGRGLAGQTNFATIADIMKNGQRAPVPIQMVGKAARAVGDLSEGNPEAAEKLAKALFETYAPGGLGGLPRTLESLTGEDIPGLGKER
jgi:hypothetical protein